MNHNKYIHCYGSVESYRTLGEYNNSNQQNNKAHLEELPWEIRLLSGQPTKLSYIRDWVKFNSEQKVRNIFMEIQNSMEVKYHHQHPIPQLVPWYKEVRRLKNGIIFNQLMERFKYHLLRRSDLMANYQYSWCMVLLFLPIIWSFLLTPHLLVEDCYTFRVHLTKNYKPEYF